MHQPTQAKTLAALSSSGYVPEVAPHRTPPIRTDHRSRKPPRAAGPDYGCVEWFIYEERSPRRDAHELETRG